MRIVNRRWLSGLTVGSIAVAAVAAVAPAAAAAGRAGCPDVEVVFARATGEFPGLGLAGTPLVSAIGRMLPGRTVGSYAVNYAAAFDQSSAGAGATDMTNHVTSQAAACPTTRFVLGGYSQGASVTDISIGIRTSLGFGQTIPDALADRVGAVVTFGNPLGLFRQTIKASSPRYGAKALELCNAGDPVCAGQGDRGPGFGHLSYPTDGSVERAAQFAAQRV